jgi:hypothetical protein
VRERPHVLAEVVLDSTSAEPLLARAESVSLPYLTQVYPPDGAKPIDIQGPAGPWRSLFDVED